MKYTLFEEPSGRSGIKKSFINLKKKIRFKIKFELWVWKLYPNININDFDEVRSKKQDLKEINMNQKKHFCCCLFFLFS